VPSLINSSKVDKFTTIRFRVGDVFKENYISLYFDNTRVMHIKKKILSPGEMEELKITKAFLDEYPKCKEITVKIEKE
jgi:sarcosine oxidase subunit alpha